jgi:hypothetical protein
MKDARGGLVRLSGLKSQSFSQVRLARVQPASHHRWQCKVIFYLVMVRWLYDVDASALNGSCLMFEIIAISQQSPCHPRVLGSDR